jgi:hypothetical protein
MTLIDNMIFDDYNQSIVRITRDRHHIIIAINSIMRRSHVKKTSH